MLDLSAALDTLDHTILLDRLSRYFGFSRTVLRWFSSYLTGRIQCVLLVTQHLAVEDLNLEFRKVRYSVLSCLLFIRTYSSYNLCSYNLHCMFYADDSQLYITIDPLDQRPAFNTLQKCIGEVIEWNIIGKLVCNPSKTEVIQFSSPFVKNPILSDFLIGNSSLRVQPSDRVRNLGVKLDRELNLAKRLC